METCVKQLENQLTVVKNVHTINNTNNLERYVRLEKPYGISPKREVNMTNTNRKCIDPSIVRHVLENAKGRKMGITALTKDDNIRVFNCNKATDNAPAFEFHKDLVSIREVGKGYKSFNVNNVLRLAFDKQVIEVID